MKHAQIKFPLFSFWTVYLAVEIPNLHKFEQGKCGTLVENQSVILKVVGSSPGTIYFEESELCVFDIRLTTQVV